AVLLAALGLVRSPSAAQQPTPCANNCAQLIVSAQAPSGGNVPVTLTFNQGPDDGQPGQGNDEIAAVAFTLGIPGVGSGNPLTLADCTVNSDGLTSAITVADAIKSTFKVVIENLTCTTATGSSRTRCLCPDAGQQTDNYINVVVYGPKDLPASGPVNIPVLPSGPLLTISLHQNSTAKTDLHVFAETDPQDTESKPQFGAFLSIGDKSAIDQTFDRGSNTSKVAITNASVGNANMCVGDCDSSGHVEVTELVKGVNIALGLAPVSDCTAFDADNSNTVTVDELVKGVNNALNGCPS
ncbi:MAG TPA: hypothetical protein VL403_01890, partial [Candidatus Kryptonia bacterium]|nr:hypothetical protein [Candidatus Kryptonia bacterium]